MVKQMKFVIAFFAMILFAVSLASASSIILNAPSLTTVVQGGSATIEALVNNTNETFSLTDIALSSDAPGFVATSTNNVANNSSGKVSFQITIPLNQSIGNLYTYELKLNGKINGTPIAEEKVNFQVNVTRSIIYDICGNEYTTQNISIGEIEDNEDGNEDEWEWMPSNKISITVNNIENNVDDDDKFDISLLFYKDGTKVSGSKIALDDDNLKIDNLKIDAEDDEDATFEFEVADDVDEDDYEMYVKVEGQYGCYVEKLSDTIYIDTEDGDYSVVTDVDGPVSPSCGDIIELSATVSNIGEDDADRVKVILYNKELGVNLYREVEDLDQGDKTDVTFSFVAPQNAAEKTYKLLLYTEFDYDDDDDSYGETSDDEYDYTYALALSGNCIDPAKPTITAKLNSTALVGKDLVIEVDVKNNANQALSAIVTPEEFESWAELVEVDPTTLSISKQASGKAHVTLKPTEAGQQTFNINVIYNGKSIDQPITVKISEKTGLLSGLFNQFGKVGAYLILGIIILIVLILLILIIRAIWNSPVGRIISYIIIFVVAIFLIVFLFYLIRSALA